MPRTPGAIPSGASISGRSFSTQSALARSSRSASAGSISSTNAQPSRLVNRGARGLPFAEPRSVTGQNISSLGSRGARGVPVAYSRTGYNAYKSSSQYNSSIIRHGDQGGTRHDGYKRSYYSNRYHHGYYGRYAGGYYPYHRNYYSGYYPGYGYGYGYCYYPSVSIGISFGYPYYGYGYGYGYGNGYYCYGYSRYYRRPYYVGGYYPYYGYGYYGYPSSEYYEDNQGPYDVYYPEEGDEARADAVEQAAKVDLQEESIDPDGLSAGQLYVVVGLVHFRAGRYDQAAESFFKATLERGDSVVPRVLLAASQFATGQFREATGALEVGLVDGSSFYTYRFDISRLYKKDGDFSAHLQRLEDFVGQNPQDQGAHLLRAFVLFSAGRGGEAENSLQVIEAIERDPRQVRIVREIRSELLRRKTAGPADADKQAALEASDPERRFFATLESVDVKALDL